MQLFEERELIELNKLDQVEFLSKIVENENVRFEIQRIYAEMNDSNLNGGKATLKEVWKRFVSEHPEELLKVKKKVPPQNWFILVGCIKELIFTTPNDVEVYENSEDGISDVDYTDAHNPTSYFTEGIRLEDVGNIDRDTLLCKINHVENLASDKNHPEAKLSNPRTMYRVGLLFSYTEWGVVAKVFGYERQGNSWVAKHDNAICNNGEMHVIDVDTSRGQIIRRTLSLSVKVADDIDGYIAELKKMMPITSSRQSSIIESIIQYGLDDVKELRHNNKLIYRYEKNETKTKTIEA